ncbi:phytase [Sphingorhabdus sp. IMCC26285]|uniref:Phytase n=1 Tax=Sphingorhabdus profundilacus TaxID=2509718 RepID=A0A6I4LW29_9SPHN|nr:phytase [Sphingorhabdus profundilacus]MVZ96276.1 phytase [Sphingorhabdus profundilacus]
MRQVIWALPLLVAGCATPQPVMSPLTTATVSAKVETQPVASMDDAADDPAIWRNAANPAESLIVATDKRAAIHVYDLKGSKLHSAPSPRLNNVDLRDLGGASGVLVAASDRQDIANAKMALFRLDTVAKQLVPLGSIAVGPGEAYGMCLWRRASDKALFGFVVMKDGRIDQVAMDLTGPVPAGKVVRSMKLGTQSEGCVADDRTGVLYVAEEDVGLWKFDASPDGPVTATALAKADGKEIVMDAEGVALSPAGVDGGYVIVSSQGDNAYAVYKLPQASYVGRFRITDGAIDGVQETDGIELMLGDFGPDFPGGLFVVQDGDNLPQTQNFKLVNWADVVAALGL